MDIDSFREDDRINALQSVLESYSLCDHCLGRLVAKIGFNLINRERGQYIRDRFLIKKSVSPMNCWLCHGLIIEIDHFVSLVQDIFQSYEFETFLIGTRIDEDLLSRERILQDHIGSDITESIKNDLNRNIGRILEEKTKKVVDFHNPDLMIIIDTVFDVVRLQIKSLYIYGRYNKFQRGIPQTKWFCRSCKGKGCRHCQYTGKLYEDSVEELIAGPIMEMAEGIDESFHGSGREDIDVRMLGRGRPFVVEIKDPKIRSLDLTQVEEQINASYKDKIAVNKLRFVDKKEIARIKEAKYAKIYRVKIAGSKAFNKEKLKKVALSLGGTIIQQFTPTRVARRRAHMIRKRQIYNCTVEGVDETMAMLIIEAESGTYIKELITGDNGRTQPNISSMLDIDCTVTSLDVIEIKGDDRHGETIKRVKK